MNEPIVRTDLAIPAQINLFYDLFSPQPVAGPAPLLIAVHGYGANKRYMMREARAVAPEHFVIASVQGPHQHFRKTDDGYRPGFGWLGDFKPEESVAVHHGFLLDLIDTLSRDGVVDRTKIFLFGFSQACAINFRFAFTYPQLLKGIIGVCGGIPSDLDSNSRYKDFAADALYLHGDDDEFYSQEQFAENEGILRKRLGSFASKKFRAGHEITDEMRAEIAEFLRSRS